MLHNKEDFPVPQYFSGPGLSLEVIPAVLVKSGLVQRDVQERQDISSKLEHLLFLGSTENYPFPDR